MLETSTLVPDGSVSACELRRLSLNLEDGTLEAGR